MTRCYVVRPYRESRTESLDRLFGSCALSSCELLIVASCELWDYVHIEVFVHIPANRLRNKHVITTSKRRFDVIIMCLSRMFAGMYAAPVSVTISYLVYTGTVTTCACNNHSPAYLQSQTWCFKLMSAWKVRNPNSDLIK